MCVCVCLCDCVYVCVAVSVCVCLFVSVRVRACARARVRSEVTKMITYVGYIISVVLFSPVTMLMLPQANSQVSIHLIRDDV